MNFEATIIEDSISESGHRLTTLQLCYPRFIHSELMTHRVMSRNAMSSRAVPVQKMIDQVRTAYAKPIHWGANQAGMQATVEVNAAAAEHLWQKAANLAADVAQEMVTLGLHKQVANRILEPFQWMRTIVTATEWDNFFELRCHPDAQPEFQKLAVMIRDAMVAHEPTLRTTQEDNQVGWHLPYVSESERQTLDLMVLRQISAARCARVSYLTHDGVKPSVEKDVLLYEKLVGSTPLHASPVEHQATPGTVNTGNFVGWTQFRKLVEQQFYTKE